MDKRIHGETGSLHGEICVVTGGGRGIGRAIVEKFLACGAAVYSIDLAHPEAAAGEERLVCLDCDITDLEAVCEIARTIGSADVLVNNAAAVTRAVPITERSPDEWHRTMAVNITGTFNVSRSFLPLMREGGRIINLASTFAHVGSPGRVAYSTTKGAIGAPRSDVDALADLLVSVSEFAAANRDDVETIDLNPVVVLPAGEGVVALDALVVPCRANR